MSESVETREEVVARHKKEAKELQNRITGMKKQANKKNRKEVNSKCELLELQMKDKHREELEKCDGADDDDEEMTADKLLALALGDTESPAEVPAAAPVEATSDIQTAGPKKRNRQKERLAKRQAEIDAIKAQAAEEAAEQPDLKKIEGDNLNMLCEMNKVVQFDIKPDGHCLFSSISDQLSLRHGIDITVQELRTRAANHIRANPDTFAPFLFDETTLTLKDLGDYTKDLENTPLWGGDMEIMALASEFDCPISVMMSGRSTLKINEDGSKPELKLIYYKHSYALGEHYNSLHDA